MGWEGVGMRLGSGSPGPEGRRFSELCSSPVAVSCAKR